LITKYCCVRHEERSYNFAQDWGLFDTGG